MNLMVTAMTTIDDEEMKTLMSSVEIVSSRCHRVIVMLVEARLSALVLLKMGRHQCSLPSPKKECHKTNVGKLDLSKT